MSRQVDERVVSMQFDNERFERNVKTSMNTLEKLNQALKGVGSSNGFDDVQKSADSIDFTKLFNNVESLSKRFSVFGIAGMRIIENLTDTAMSKFGSLFSFVQDGIIEGGKSRAQNLENAHFQLQGLLEDEKAVSAVMADVNTAVSGTAYGLDAAANVASQLAASGLTAGDQMLHALQGIAGVAATTNSSFEEIGTIWTTAAGKGKVQADELNRLAFRGMNAAAALAKQLGTTEEAVREMASKGKIDFQTFSEAMNDAFGKHAQDANQTFTGVLSNVRAALARTGAMFYSPLIEQNGVLVKLLNTVREKINQINGTLGPLANMTTAAIESMATKLTGFVAKLDFSKNPVADLFSSDWDNFTKKIESTGLSVDEFRDKLQKLALANGSSYAPLLGSVAGLKKVFGDGEISADMMALALKRLSSVSADATEQEKEQAKAVRKLSGELLRGNSEARALVDGNREITSSLDTVVKIIDNVSQTFSKVGEAFRGAMSEMKAFGSFDISGGIKRGLEGVEKFTSKLIPNEKKVDQLRRTFKGLLSAIDLVSYAIGRTLSAAFDLIGKAFGETGFDVLELTAKIGDSITAFNEWVHTSQILVNTGEIISNTFGTLVTTIKNFIEKVKGISIVQTIADGIKGAVAIIGEQLGLITRSAAEMSEGFTSAFNAAGSGLEESLLIKSLRFIGTTLGKIVKTVGRGVSDLFSNLGDVLKNLDSKDVANFANAIAALGIGLRGLGTGSIAGIGVEIQGILGSLYKAVETYASTKSVSLFQSVAKSMLILAGACLILASIDTGKLAKATTVIVIMMRELAAASKLYRGTGALQSEAGFKNFLKAMAGDISAVHKNSMMANNLIKLAASVLILAAAIKMISDIDGESLANAFGVITGLIIELTVVMEVLSSKDPTKMAEGVGGLILIAVAVNLLALAVKQLAKLDAEQMAQGLAGVTVLLIGLHQFLSKTDFDQLGFKSGAGLILMAVALKILASVIKDIAEIDSNSLEQGLIGLGLVLFGLYEFLNRTNLDGMGFKSGAGLVLMAASLKIIASVMSDLAAMEPDRFAQSLVGIMVLLKGVSLFLTELSNPQISSTVMKSAAAFVILSVSLKIIASAMNDIATLSIDQLLTAALGLGSMVAILTVALSHMEGTLSGAAAMLVASVAIKVLASALQQLGSMSLPQIGKSILALAASLAVLWIAGIALEPLVGVFVSLGASLALFGVGILAIGGGLVLIGAGLAAVGVGLVTLVANIAASVQLIIGIGSDLAAALFVVIESVANAITNAAPAIGEAVIALAEQVIKMAKTLIPELVTGFLEMVLGVLDGLVQYAPQIIEKAITLICSVLDQLATGIPRMLASIMNFLGSLFQAVIDALNSLDSDNLLKLLEGIGILTAIMFAMAGLSALAGPAALGLLAFGGLITELVAILAAVGAIAQIPGIEWLVGEGGDLLMTVGNAIGKFVGGILGGIGEGVTASLVPIAENLADFIVAIQPFIEGASKIDPSILNGVNALADTILILTGADLLSHITSFLTGDSSFEQLGEKLSGFADAMSEFAEKTKDIDADVVTRAANAGKALAEFASAIPNSGGVAGFFAGNNDADDFGDQIKGFGSAIMEYANSVRDITEEDIVAIQTSITAGKLISEFASTLQNSGGVAAFFAGDNDVGTFGEQLIALGEGLSGYSKSVSGENAIDYDAIAISVEALESIASISESIPDMGGFLSLFSADNDFSTFGYQIELLGLSLFTFSSYVADIDVEQLNGVITSLSELSDIAVKISSLDSLDNFEGFIEAIKELVKSGLDTFKKEVADSKVTIFEAGEGLLTEFINGIKKKEDAYKTALKNILKAGETAIKNQRPSYYQCGVYLMQGFDNGMISMESTIIATATRIANAAAEAMNDALVVRSPSRRTRQTGIYFGKGFVNGITSQIRNALNAGMKMGEATLGGLDSAVSTIVDYIDGAIDAQPRITPILDLSQVRASAAQLSALTSMNEAMGIAASFSAQDTSRIQNDSANKSTPAQPTQINYTQNNYSPKALSRVEIYRQTKNQLNASFT